MHFRSFLTIGGATKFIPMTGVTLPLVSYGGSSVMSTILMLAIIQGLYILREDEDEEFERRRKEAVRREFEQERKRAERTRYLKEDVPETREYTFVSWCSLWLFLWQLIGYLVYFNAVKSEDFINSPYNTRQDTFSDRVVRGQHSFF